MQLLLREQEAARDAAVEQQERAEGAARRANQAAEQRADRMRAELLELEHALEERRDEVAEAQQRLAELSMRLERESRAHAERAAKHAEDDAARRAELEDLERRAEAARGAVDEWAGREARARRESEEQAQALQRARRELEQLRRETDALIAERETAEELAERQQRAASVALNELVARRRKLGAEVRQLEEKHAGVREKLGKVRAAHQRIVERQEQARKQAAGHAQRASELISAAARAQREADRALAEDAELAEG